MTEVVIAVVYLVFLFVAPQKARRLRKKVIIRIERTRRFILRRN